MFWWSIKPTIIAFVNADCSESLKFLLIDSLGFEFPISMVKNSLRSSFLIWSKEVLSYTNFLCNVFDYSLTILAIWILLAWEFDKWTLKALRTLRLNFSFGLQKYRERKFWATSRKAELELWSWHVEKHDGEEAVWRILDGLKSVLQKSVGR